MAAELEVAAASPSATASRVPWSYGGRDESSLCVVVLGASGDLAKKKTFPALFDLFHADLLPREARRVLLLLPLMLPLLPVMPCD
jgi:hypothetical protein